jgi:lipopolysaccharide/colanic/teichoic acid biosynthesis glycosyltransferase
VLSKCGSLGRALLCLADVTALAAVGIALRAGLPAIAIAAATWPVSAVAFGLCDRRWWPRPHLLPLVAAKTWAGSSLLCLLALAILPSSIVPARTLALPLAGAVVAITLRALWRATAVRRRQPVLVVDAVGEARLKRWLAHYWPEWDIVGILDGSDPSAVKRLADARRAQVAYYLNGQQPPLGPGPLAPLPLDDLLEWTSGRVRVDCADEVKPRWARVDAATKRAVDICVAAVGLAVLSPLMTALAALIKLESRGPALYRQRRLGLGCRPFQMLKFRSMVDQAEQETGPVWAQDDDPRCTPLGRILRPLHLDELPQLVNVLRGEMSLIGPRPERPELSEDLLQTMPAYRGRLTVKPGITGWAQVNQGYDREMDDVRRKLEYDLFYVKRGGLLFDAAILLRTVDAVIFGKPRRAAQHELP